ncbi:MAG TPA: YceI family protein [Hyphomicrobium sp.]|nr:YceI family protein [Hyphomicrobium sp.]
MKPASPRLLLLALLATAIVAAAPARAADYVIDTAKSHASINFRIKHLGFSWLTGRFNEFSGTFTFDEAHAEAAKVKVEVDTESIDSNHAERDKHLRSKEFLDTATYPTATFESTGVKVNGDKVTITGNLTLHGVTKPIEIAAERVGGGDDPWGGFRQGFTGTTRIPLKDFGINFDLGPASQEVELTLNIEGVRQ